MHIGFSLIESFGMKYAGHGFQSIDQARAGN
jgi:hypothetical protein